MLRKFAAVLLASSMIAGAAFAAQPSGGAAQATPAATTGSHPKNVAMPTSATKHLRKHVQKHDRKHHARSKFHVTKEARHLKGSKAHKAQVAGITKSVKFPKTAGKQSAKLPATRSSTN
jgi:hypothetical protein